MKTMCPICGEITDIKGNRKTCQNWICIKAHDRRMRIMKNADIADMISIEKSIGVSVVRIRMPKSDLNFIHKLIINDPKKTIEQFLIESIRKAINVKRIANDIKRRAAG